MCHRARRDLMTMAHAAARTISTVEKLHAESALRTPFLSAVTVPVFYVDTVAGAPRVLGRCRCSTTSPRGRLRASADYAKLSATRRLPLYLDRRLHHQARRRHGLPPEELPADVIGG